MFQINKSSSKIREAIPYLADQIRAMVSLALIYLELSLFDYILSHKPGRSSHAEDSYAVSSLEQKSCGWAINLNRKVVVVGYTQEIPKSQNEKIFLTLNENSHFAPSIFQSNCHYS